MCLSHQLEIRSFAWRDTECVWRGMQRSLSEIDSTALDFERLRLSYYSVLVKG